MAVCGKQVLDVALQGGHSFCKNLSICVAKPVRVLETPGSPMAELGAAAMADMEIFAVDAFNMLSCTGRRQA